MSIQTASAFAGTANIPRLPLNSSVDLNGIIVSPAGGRTFHVRGDGTSILAYDDQYGQNTADMNQRLWPSVASVVPFLVANRGDNIIVHRNHTENFASANSLALPAGTRVFGQGWGNNRPTFTFTTATSTLLLTAAGVVFQNCRFLCAGPAGTTALSVAAPITITGEGCLLVNNFFEIGIDADQLCTDFMTVAGDNCGLFNNKIMSQALTSVNTSIITLGNATAGANGFVAYGNTIKGALSAATTGVIRNLASTGTSAEILIQENFLQNWKADSSVCISMAANQVTTGVVKWNTFRVSNNASVQGITYSGTGVDLSMDNNSIQNEVNETCKQNQGTVSA
jgi:hypothetical protein